MHESLERQASFDPGTRGVLAVIAGLTGVGKSEVLRRLCNGHPEMKRVVSVTTRLPRAGEEPFVDYEFLTKRDFKIQGSESEFLETVTLGDYQYGTRTRDLLPTITHPIRLWILDPSSAYRAKDILASNLSGEVARMIIPRTMTILLESNLGDLRQRCIKDREDRLNDFEERIKRELEMVAGTRELYDHVVFNEQGKLPQTLKKVAYLIGQKDSQG